MRMLVCVCVCVCVHVRSEHECVRTTPLLLMRVMTNTTCTHAHVHVASTLFPTFCPMLAARSPASPQINWCREWGRFGVTNLSLFYYVVTRCIVFCARCAHTHTFFRVCLCLGFSLDHLESLHLLCGEK